MLIYVCALECEARPLIMSLGLRKTGILHAFQVFSKDNKYLLITGVGSIKAAIAVTALISELKSQNSRNSMLLINVGTCGSANLPIGDVVLPHTILNTDNKKKFFQEILIPHKFHEVSLLTVNTPGIFRDRKADCIDMESYGYFQAASVFLLSSRICCIKVVSDNLNKKYLDKNEVSGLIGKNIPLISDFADNMLKLINRPEILNLKDREILKKVCDKLRFTQYQIIATEKAAFSYKVRHKSGFDFLLPFAELIPENKMQVKDAYLRMQEQLNA